MTGLLGRSVAATSVVILVAASGCSPENEVDAEKSSESAWVALSGETILPLGKNDQTSLLGVSPDGESSLIEKGAASYAPLLVRFGEGYVYPDGDGLVELAPDLRVSRRHKLENASVVTFAVSARHAGAEAAFLFNSPQGNKDAPNLIVKVSPTGVRQIRTGEEVSALAICNGGEVVWLSTKPNLKEDVTGPGKVRLNTWSDGQGLKEGIPFDVQQAPAMFSPIDCGSDSPHAVAVTGGGGREDPHWNLTEVSRDRKGAPRRIPRVSSHALGQAWSVQNGRSYLVTWEGGLESFNVQGDPEPRVERLPLNGKTPDSATFDNGRVYIVATRNDGTGDRSVYSVDLSNAEKDVVPMDLKNWKNQSLAARLKRGDNSFVSVVSILPRG